MSCHDINKNEVKTAEMMVQTELYIDIFRVYWLNYILFYLLS